MNNSDLVITVTDNDQINTILSIIAKKRGSKSVISVINNESYSSFANDLGIDVIINPRELTTSRIIEKISKEKKMSILLASHNMDEVKRLCKNVLMMNNGVIIDKGAPEDLIKKHGKRNLEEVFLKLNRNNHELK